MDLSELWDLIETARDEVDDPDDAEAVTAALRGILAESQPETIEEFDVALGRLMAESYRTDLWAAAYVINGGASDDGFEYFRGWPCRSSTRCGTSTTRTRCGCACRGSPPSPTTPTERVADALRWPGPRRAAPGPVRRAGRRRT